MQSGRKPVSIDETAHCKMKNVSCCCDCEACFDDVGKRVRHQSVVNVEFKNPTRCQPHRRHLAPLNVVSNLSCQKPVQLRHQRE